MQITVHAEDARGQRYGDNGTFTPDNVAGAITYLRHHFPYESESALQEALSSGTLKRSWTAPNGETFVTIARIV